MPNANSNTCEMLLFTTDFVIIIVILKAMRCDLLWSGIGAVGLQRSS